jgi:Cu/Ag efflux protein CusF
MASVGGHKRAQTDGATQVVAKLRAELQQLTIDHERLKATQRGALPCALPSARRPRRVL